MSAAPDFASSPKSLNRSLKSELTNIEAFDLCAVNDQFPGGIETRLRGLRLPELKIKRAIQFAEFAGSFYEICSRHALIIASPPTSIRRPMNPKPKNASPNGDSGTTSSARSTKKRRHSNASARSRLNGTGRICGSDSRRPSPPCQTECLAVHRGFLTGRLGEPKTRFGRRASDFGRKLRQNPRLCSRMASLRTGAEIKPVLGHG